MIKKSVALFNLKFFLEFNLSLNQSLLGEKDFDIFIEKLNIKVIKKVNKNRYYSKIFLFFSNPNLHFIYLLK